MKTIVGGWLESSHMGGEIHDIVDEFEEEGSLEALQLDNI